jgi:outer membrane protein TolC
MSWALCVAVVFISSFVRAVEQDWPVEAQKYLAEIPGRKLTLEFVVVKALNSADSFQIHGYDALRAESLYFQTTAYEDFRLKAGYNYYDNQNEPLLPLFQPNSTVGWESTVGLEKNFSTGTAVSFEGVHSPKRVGFLSGSSFDAYETRATLGLQQDLLNNFFGSSYRKSRRSADQAKQSMMAGIQAKLESSTLDLIGLYYQAWLKKEISLNWLEAKKRKEKLVKIMQSQAKRGFIEVADVLQIEGAALQTDLQYLSTQRELQNIWEQLVLNLKLPRTFLKVPAEDIPLILDAPENKSLELCEKIQFQDLEKNSSRLREAEHQLQSSRENFEAQREKMLPELKLNASYSANSIEADDFTTGSGYQAQGHKTFREVADLENPAWSAGLQLVVPLQNRAQKAQYLRAVAEYEQAKLKKSILLADLENQWTQSCAQFKIKIHERDRYKQINDKNRRRVQLDNRRFEVGRIKAFQWVQTEDDEAQTLIQYKQSEVEARQLAWDIQRQSGHMAELVREHLPKVSLNE